MLDFIRKSPLGFAIAAATIVLTVSPEARQATRRLAVKGTTIILDLVDQARSTAALPTTQTMLLPEKPAAEPQLESNP